MRTIRKNKQGGGHLAKLMTMALSVMILRGRPALLPVLHHGALLDQEALLHHGRHAGDGVCVCVCKEATGAVSRIMALR